MNQKKQKQHYSNPKDERFYQERLKFLLHYYKELTDITRINQNDDPLAFPSTIQIGSMEIKTSSAHELRTKVNTLRYWVLEDILRGVSLQVEKKEEPNPKTENK